MNDISKPTRYQRTWMLFESGNGVAVDLSLFAPPKETHRPIDAFLVTEVEGHLVTKSARRAAGAAYEAVGRYRADLRPTVAGFDFVGNSSVTGESGGLAFALALAKRLMEKDPGPVAATGIVESSHNGGPVKAVRGIEAKLLAASMVLPPGGWVCYPKENDRNIPRALKKDLAEKGLRLIPVSTVFEAVDALFSEAPPATSHRGEAESKKAPIIATLMAIALLLALGAGLAFWRPEFFGFPQKDAGIDSPKLAKNEPLNISENSTSPPAEKEAARPAAKSPAGENSRTPDGKSGQESRISRPETDDTPHESEKSDVGQPIDSETPEVEKTSVPQIDISGKSYLGSRVASILTQRLKDHFNITAEDMANPTPIAISGEVVVLFYEEFWSEEKQKFEYALKAQIRDLTVEKEDKFRKNDSSIIRVIADKDTEELLSAAADSLLDRVLARPKNRTAPRIEKRSKETPRESKSKEKPQGSGFE